MFWKYFASAVIAQVCAVVVMAKYTARANEQNDIDNRLGDAFATMLLMVLFIGGDLIALLWRFLEWFCGRL